MSRTIYAGPETANVTSGVFLTSDGCTPETRIAYVPEHMDVDRELKARIVRAWRASRDYPLPLTRARVYRIAAEAGMDEAGGMDAAA